MPLGIDAENGVVIDARYRESGLLFDLVKVIYDLAVLPGFLVDGRSSAGKKVHPRKFSKDDDGLHPENAGSGLLGR